MAGWPQKRWLGPTMMLVLLSLQIVLSWHLRAVRPALEEIPPAPSESVIRLLTLGDDQFLFRAVGRWLQGVGDGDGRVKRLIDYDYDRVVAWLACLDRLDHRSEMVYILGTRYYGAVIEPVRGPAQIRKIVVFFRQIGLADPVHQWPALVWAATRVVHQIKDPLLADQIAHDLLTLPSDPDIPEWLGLLAEPLYRLSGNQPAYRALVNDPGWLAMRQRQILQLEEKLKK